jgi:hypothetical protein
MNTFFGITLLSFVIFIVCTVARYQKNIALPLLLGLFFRVSFTLIYNFLPFLSFWGDSVYSFEAIGWDWSKQGLISVLTSFTTGADFYSWLIGLFYVPFPRSKLAIISINVLFSTLIIRECYLLGKVFGGGNTGRRAAWISSVFPVLVIFSGVAVREVMIQFFFVIGVRYFSHWIYSKRTFWLAFSYFFMMLASAFHGALLPLMAVLLVFHFSSFFYKRSENFRVYPTNQAKLRSLFLLLNCLFLFFASISFGWGRKITKVTHNIEQADKVIVSSMEERASGRAQYYGNVESSSWPEIIATFVYRSPFFLFTPFPWMVTSARDILGVIDGILYLLLFLQSMYVLFNQRLTRQYLFAVSIVVLFVLIFSQVSNYGTALRHRAKVAPILISLGTLYLFPFLRLK